MMSKKKREIVSVIIKVLISIVLTIFFFITDVRDTYNVFLIIAVFAMFLLFLDSYLMKSKNIAMRKKVLSMICGLILASTYFVGVLIEFHLGFLLHTARGIFRVAAYLILRVLLFSGLSFYVFTCLDDKRKTVEKKATGIRGH